MRSFTQRCGASRPRLARAGGRFARNERRRHGNDAPEPAPACRHADNGGMSSPAWFGSAFSPHTHVPGPRLVRAQRFAALLTMSLFALGVFVPGDAIARAAKHRAAKAKRESGWCSY